MGKGEFCHYAILRGPKVDSWARSHTSWPKGSADNGIEGINNCILLL